MPPSGDFIAEIRTRRYDTLTYARSAAEAEDMTLFDRKRQHNIAVYASAQKIARRGGRFYNDDDLADYDVLHYDIDLAYSPERQWLDGRRAHTPASARDRDQHADDAARRFVDGAVDRERSARTAVRHPCVATRT